MSTKFSIIENILMDTQVISRNNIDMVGIPKKHIKQIKEVSLYQAI